jgi:Ca-activated chloride channel family protein
MMARNAGDDIGATLFGVGVNYDDELAYDISQVRGANLFFLNDYDRIVTIFDEEFDYLVTPVAYDVKLVADVPFELDVADVYGLPEVATNTHVLTMTIPTLFLSSREGGGAIMIRLRPGAQVDFGGPIHAANVELTFAESPEAAPSKTTFQVMLPAGLDEDAATPYFETPGVQRGVLLLNTALTLKSACDDAYNGWGRGSYYQDRYYAPDYQRARERLTEFLPYFDALAAGLEDQPSPESRSLSQERAVIERLLANLGDV